MPDLKKNTPKLGFYFTAHVTKVKEIKDRKKQQSDIKYISNKKMSFLMKLKLKTLLYDFKKINNALYLEIQVKLHFVLKTPS